MDGHTEAKNAVALGSNDCNSCYLDHKESLARKKEFHEHV